MSAWATRHAALPSGTTGTHVSLGDGPDVHALFR